MPVTGNSACAAALERLIRASDRSSDAALAARKLLQGTVREWDVFEMAADDVSARTGLDMAAAMAVDLVDELSRYADIERMGKAPVLDSAEALGGYFGALLRGRHVEYCYLACMDARRRLLRCVQLGRGTLDRSEVHLRDIAQAALRTGAKTAALAHNHPGGTLAPSREDVELTRRAMDVLAVLDVKLTEHIIAARGGFVGIISGGYL